MRLLNWNVQADKLKLDSGKFARIKARIDGFDADVVCLTEAYSELMPDHERTIASRPGNRGWQAPGGKRKVMLWSRYGWQS